MNDEIKKLKKDNEWCKNALDSAYVEIEERKEENLNILSPKEKQIQEEEEQYNFIKELKQN